MLPPPTPPPVRHGGTYPSLPQDWASRPHLWTAVSGLKLKSRGSAMKTIQNMVRLFEKKEEKKRVGLVGGGGPGGRDAGSRGAFTGRDVAVPGKWCRVPGKWRRVPGKSGPHTR